MKMVDFRKIRVTLFLRFFVFLVMICSAVIAQEPVTRTPINRLTANPQTINPQRNLRRVVPPELLDIQRITVPPLVGRPYSPDQISVLLNRYGLKLGSATPVENSDSVAIILGQSPGARQQVLPQTEINITYGVPVQVATPTQPRRVTVPQYVGLALENVVSRMPDDRLEIGTVTEVFSDSDPGMVISQFPEPRTIVVPGTAINLDVSAGTEPEQTVLVPFIRGLTLQEAAARLKEAGLFAGNITERVSDEREGIVLEQFPAENTEVSLRSSVDIVFSVQTAVEMVEVPDLIDLNPDEAILLLKENRLNYAMKEISEPGKNDNTVTMQVPEAGSLVPADTEITFFVQKKEQNNTLIFWGAGLLVAVAAGGFAGYRIKTGKSKNRLPEKVRKPEIKDVWDVGKQSISFNGEKLTGKQIQFRFVNDMGIQSIKTEKDEL